MRRPSWRTALDLDAIIVLGVVVMVASIALTTIVKTYQWAVGESPTCLREETQLMPVPIPSGQQLVMQFLPVTTCLEYARETTR